MTTSDAPEPERAQVVYLEAPPSIVFLDDEATVQRWLQHSTCQLYRMARSEGFPIHHRKKGTRKYVVYEEAMDWFRAQPVLHGGAA